MMDELDALFATARHAEVTPSNALMARVMADAVALQPKAEPMGRAVARKTGFWTGLAALFGGSGVLAGLASVAMAGFFVGFVQPETVSALAGDWTLGSVVETVDLMPGVDALLAED